MDDELGPRFECDSCNLSFYVVADNDVEIMDHGLQIHYCPRCGNPGVQCEIGKPATPPEPPTSSSDVLDLMKALKASLKQRA